VKPGLAHGLVSAPRRRGECEGGTLRVPPSPAKGRLRRPLSSNERAEGAPKARARRPQAAKLDYMKVARSPKRAATLETPKPMVMNTVMARAAPRENGTRTGVRSPSGTGRIHISLAMLA
jgi:hypothetical protein